jgi:excisionase family DNA binding protein
MDPEAKLPQPKLPEKLAYRIDEAIHVSGLGRTTIYDEIKSQRLKSVKVAGRRLILREDLEAFLKASDHAE